MSFPLYKICVITAFLQLSTISGYSQLLDEEKLPILSIDLFKGTPKKDAPYAAEIYIQINYFYNVVKLKDDGTVLLDIKVNVFPDSSKSVFDRSRVKKSAYADLISHERGHLLIGYSFGNFLKAGMDSGTYTKDYKQELQAVFDKYFRNYNELQHLYDEKTKHGTDQDEQEKWYKKLKKLYLESPGRQFAVLEL